MPLAVFLRLGTTPLSACIRQRRSWLCLIHSGVLYLCVWMFAIHTTLMRPGACLPLSSTARAAWGDASLPSGSWGGRCTCPNGEAYQVGDNDDACHSLACVNGRPGACFKRPAGSDGEHRRVICVSHPFAATSELSQLDHAPKPCPPCDHSCIEDPITGMALRGEDWHEMAFDTRPFGGADR